MSAKWKFIFIYGLTWGIFTVLGIAAWEIWIDHRQFSLEHLIIRLMIFSLAGIAWGSGMWKFYSANKDKRHRSPREAGLK